MRVSKAIIAGSLAAAFMALSASSADAYWRGYHHGYYHGYYHGGPGPVLGLVGGVLVGAATIATAPFAILGAAVDGGPPPPPRGYYGPPSGYYAPPPPAPGYYAGYYDRAPRYYGPPPDYYGR